MYTITLADGTTKLTGLSKNGDNFISESKVDESIFTDNLSTMTIADEDTSEETVMTDVELIQQVQYDEDGDWYLCFRELSEQEKTEQAYSDGLTDVQLALAEIYEMVIGGNS